MISSNNQNPQQVLGDWIIGEVTLMKSKEAMDKRKPDEGCGPKCSRFL